MLYPRQSGLFLVRNNQHFEGDYTLSLVYDPLDVVGSHKLAIEHYRIKKSKEPPIKLTIDDEEYFDNLADLVKVGSENFSVHCNLDGMYMGDCPNGSHHFLCCMI